MENKRKISVKRLLDGRVTDGPHETPDFKVTGVPFLSVDGIQDGKLIFQGCRYISQQDSDNYRKKCAPRFGDVLLGKAASVGKVAFVDVDFIFSVWSPLALLRPKSNTLDGKYLYYCIQSELVQYQIRLFSNFNTQQNIGMRDIENLYIPDLPIVQQKSIARFLDRKTAAIDTLIAKKQRLIQLLEEKRTALINQAVTKGLNPNAPMKDSGIPWIGEIPEHWEVKRLKYLTRKIIDGTHFTPTYTENGVPFLRVTDIHDSDIDWESVKFISETEHLELSKRCKVEKGDVLLSKNGTIGITFVVNFDQPVSIFVSLCLIKLRKDILLSDFFSSLFQTYAIDEQIAEGSKKNTVTNLHLNKISEFWIPVPPVAEQQRILHEVDKAWQQSRSLIKSINHQIEKLQEYRRSLITAAVTGKLDIHNLNQEA